MKRINNAATVKQILDGKHITRGQRVHMCILQAFFVLYLEGFLENDPVLRTRLEQLSREISEACSEGVKERIQRAHQRFVNAINSSKVIRKMSEYDNQNKVSPLFEGGSVSVRASDDGLQESPRC